jgi:uncharacterized protein
MSKVMGRSLSACWLTFSLLLLTWTALGQSPAIDGNWYGTLDAGGAKLRLVLKISKAPDGKLRASLDSLDQGAKDLPISSVSLNGTAFEFGSTAMGMTYVGQMDAAGTEIKGTFKQGPNTFPLRFSRTPSVVKQNRPQDPKPPYPYDEAEITYVNKKDNVKLAGTLSIPRTEGPHPVVLMITGSGTQDRNESVAGHRPFLIWADYLTRRGIAVLRVDDRGAGGSERGPAGPTSETFTEDVLSGVEYLKTRKEIDKKRIGLIGHSEGGMIAPMAAARSKDIAFIVLLAGLGQTGADVIYLQSELIQKAGGAPPAATQQTLSALKSVMAVLKAEKDNKIAQVKIKETLDQHAAKLSGEEKDVFAAVRGTIEPQLPMYVSQWFRYFVQYDPKPTLKKVRVPVLAVNGENDLQVSSKENLDGIAAGLAAGGNTDVTIKSFPKLNHLFQSSKTGAPNEYGQIEESISPEVLQFVADWIAAKTGLK